MMADLGRSLDGHDFGGIEILQIEAFITGEALRRVASGNATF
jgi:hypothetical protein